MEKRPSAVELVDQLLAAQKEFIGDPQYRPPNRASGQARLRWPVLVNGESAQCTVEMTQYFNDLDLRFTVGLMVFEKNVWRLDFEPPDRRHANPILPGHPNSLEIISGPHSHRWEENRRLAKRGQIPDPLGFAVPLPASVRTWEQAIRHFVQETNIDPPRYVPEWQERGALAV